MITGVILTHNEEANIVRCIEHLRPHVSELILIDTSSTDRTRELATPLVDMVLSHPHVMNFDAVRNKAIPVAKNDWLWFVDADEFVPAVTGELVNRWVQDHGHELEAITIPFKSHFCGRWMQHCGWWPGYTGPRVLKRGHFEFSEVLHGGVLLEGREALVPAEPELGIEHLSYRNLSHWLAKTNRYTTTEAAQLARDGVRYDWREAVQSMVRDLWHTYERKDGRLDGERGWILAVCAGFYRWMAYAKLIDHRKSPESNREPSSVPEDLDEFLDVVQATIAACRVNQITLPLGVAVRAPVWDSSSEAEEARAAIGQLCAAGRTVVLESLSSQRSVHLPDPERILLTALENGKRARSSFTISYCGARILPADQRSCYNAIRLSGVGSLTSEDVKLLNEYDEVWISDSVHEGLLASLGVARERLHLIQPAVPKTSSGKVPFVESRLQELEKAFLPQELPTPDRGQLCVRLEGEFFAGHSFSNINEQLGRRFATDCRLAVSLTNAGATSSKALQHELARPIVPYFDRQLANRRKIVVRHQYPPNWNPPDDDIWIHIQPWEFGTLPKDWIKPIRDQVHEVWVMSRYVERVYLNSGINPDKIRYMPWGIDEHVFNPDVPQRFLPNAKTFRFVYVGGTITRKGFDRVLAAYLEEFSAEDDVCLVVKDVGTQTFYRIETLRQEIFEAQRQPSNPQIHYFDDDFSSSQLASLYAACDCLVAPYRGEGFGLPVLEAMACGLPAIVPKGGPTDDFVNDDNGYLLPSQEIPAEGVQDLCGPATEFSVTLADLRAAMRRAYERRAETHRKGSLASRHVRSRFTWEQTVAQMTERMLQLGRRHGMPEPESSTVYLDSPSAALSSIANVALIVHGTSNVTDFSRTVSTARESFDYVGILGPLTEAELARLDAAFGAKPLDSDAEQLATMDWLMLLSAGEYPESDELAGLKAWLGTLPPEIDEIAIPIASDEAVQEKTYSRIVRLRRPLERLEVEELAGQIAQEPRRFGTAMAPFTLKRAGAIAPAHNKAACKTAEQPAPASEPRRAGSKLGATASYGCLEKSVLIQMASGDHLELLGLTRDHHRKYAVRHNMDYWDLAGAPCHGKRPGWGKIPLVLAAISMGYKSIIWLDADAVILRSDLNLADLVSDGIGLVRHPMPEHWNTGMMVTKASAETEQWWQEVNRAPDNDSAWMEQLVVNELAKLPRYRGLIHQLDLRFNSVPGFAMAREPVVVAGHGFPLDLRRSVISDGLKGRYNAAGTSPASRVSSRDELSALLNELGLKGEAVEVGVLRGHFSEAFLSKWKGRVLHSVDAWRNLPKYRDIANSSDAEHELNMQATLARLRRFGERSRVHRLLSTEASSRFPDGVLDFVYLDANHSFESVWQDINAWYPKLRMGGILAGHDYLDGELPEGDFGVASAVGVFQQIHRVTVEVTDDPPWPSWFFVKSV